MKEERILITGGLGFIGLHTAQLLVEQRRRVLLLDNLSPQIHGMVPDLSSVALLKHPLVEVVRSDVCEPGVWDKTLADIGCVVHLAAETGTGQSMYEISRYENTNVGGTATLLNYLANNKHKVGKIVLASSRSVYGEGAYNCQTCGLVYPRCARRQCFVCGNGSHSVQAVRGQSRRPLRRRVRRPLLLQSMRLRSSHKKTWCASPRRLLEFRP